jgi:hypothetical protein
MGKAGTLGFLVKRVPAAAEKASKKIAQALPFMTRARVFPFSPVCEDG